MRAAMALLQTFSPSTSTLSMSLAATPMTTLQRKSFNLQPKLFNGLRVCTPCGTQERGAALVVRASADIDGATGSPDPPPEAKEEVVPVENLPLESKLQEKLDAKLRMKLAKKIRLRRKRLVRKRRMRKKGRWPPSKMKKNKNV
ncbi:hypothetical protein ACHQM5_018566 [Ranunculus cassubicifolius]